MYTLQLEKFIANPNVYILPGVTHEAVETCSRFLQENHEQHHVYFNSETGFHNHTTHHILAALGLGASAETLERIYREQNKMQKSAYPIHNKQEFDPEKCLGDDKYYPDYLQLFEKELANEKYHGNIEELIEHYLFNKGYLALALGGAYHSFIHLGYALEFQSKVMAVEGLAMGAVDRADVREVVNHIDYNPNKDGEKTALEIIELIYKDHRFDDKVFFKDEGVKIDKLLERGGGPLIIEYAQMWKCDVNDLRQAGVLVSAAVIRPKKAVRLDFFLVHATTSCLFLEILLNSFQEKENQLKFLRAKFAVDLLYYAGFGRPKLNIDYLINEYQPSKEHSYADAQNPWLPLIDKCLTHPDEHVPKTIRALVYAEKFDKKQLPYLKIAQMVMDGLFPAEEKDWVHEGIGWDEYWKTVEDL